MQVWGSALHVIVLLVPASWIWPTLTSGTRIVVCVGRMARPVVLTLVIFSWLPLFIHAMVYQFICTSECMSSFLLLSCFWWVHLYRSNPHLIFNFFTVTVGLLQAADQGRCQQGWIEDVQAGYREELGNIFLMFTSEFVLTSVCASV
jgi:hypothetical protein